MGYLGRPMKQCRIYGSSNLESRIWGHTWQKVIHNPRHEILKALPIPSHKRVNTVSDMLVGCFMHRAGFSSLCPNLEDLGTS